MNMEVDRGELAPYTDICLKIYLQTALNTPNKPPVLIQLLGLGFQTARSTTLAVWQLSIRAASWYKLLRHFWKVRLIKLSRGIDNAIHYMHHTL